MTKNASTMTFEQRALFGKSRRKVVHRVNQGPWVTPLRRQNPIEIILNLNAKRVPELVPIKMGRMAQSPFRYFRGTAPVMAADLATTLNVGLRVQMCGDAHLLNLGAFAAPDGHLVFDINDFDETYPGPFEWDLKRLATSFVLAGEDAGESEKHCVEAVLALVQSYREAMHQFAKMSKIELTRFEVHRHSKAAPIREILGKAERVTPKSLLQKYTEKTEDGSREFIDKPPGFRRCTKEEEQAILASLPDYRETLSVERQSVFDAYRPVATAFKIVGVGSVATRNYVVLCLGQDADDALFLQIKEAPPSCYAPYVPDAPFYENQGKRVAEGQRIIQTVFDPFLGYTQMNGHDFLVRQFADYKASVDPDELKGDALVEFANVCGPILADAHARTGDPAMLSGYVGDSDKLDKALAQFAVSYALQNQEDYQVFERLVKSGQIPAVDG